eukprot:Sspe_Gene.89610::Locus_61347_Transcript_1_1_Confidence_1.000_Length_1295::g.89610::m.89610
MAMGVVATGVLLVVVGLVGWASGEERCVVDGKSYCGGRSAGQCWCNEQCVKYNDCCADYVGACTGSPGSAGVEVIMTDPDCNVCTAEDKAELLSKSRIIARVVELVDGATKSIDVAQFTFSRTVIEEALVRAHERGVAVRVAMDDGQDVAESLATRLRERGVAVRFVSGKKATSENGYDGLQHRASSWWWTGGCC